VKNIKGIITVKTNTRGNLYLTESMVARLRQINRGFAIAVNEPTCHADCLLLNAGLIEFRTKKMKDPTFGFMGCKKSYTNIHLTQMGGKLLRKTWNTQLHGRNANTNYR
jgi:hypothetical protein